MHLVEPCIVHPLFERIFPQELLNMHAGFLKIYFQNINLFSDVQYSVFIDLVFDSES